MEPRPLTREDFDQASHYNAIVRSGIRTTDDLARKTRGEVLSLVNAGPKTLANVERILGHPLPA